MAKLEDIKKEITKVSEEKDFIAEQMRIRDEEEDKFELFYKSSLKELENAKESVGNDTKMLADIEGFQDELVGMKNQLVEAFANAKDELLNKSRSLEDDYESLLKKENELKLSNE